MYLVDLKAAALLLSQSVGQLKPLDRIAREKLINGVIRCYFVPPEMAGRFEAAYDALTDAVEANDVMTTNQIAGQLMSLGRWRKQLEATTSGWDYCVEIEAKNCFIASKNARFT